MPQGPGARGTVGSLASFFEQQTGTNEANNANGGGTASNMSSPTRPTRTGGGSHRASLSATSARSFTQTNGVANGYGGMSSGPSQGPNHKANLSFASQASSSSFSDKNPFLNDILDSQANANSAGVSPGGYSRGQSFGEGRTSNISNPFSDPDSGPPSNPFSSTNSLAVEVIPDDVNNTYNGYSSTTPTVKVSQQTTSQHNGYRSSSHASLGNTGGNYGNSGSYLSTSPQGSSFSQRVSATSSKTPPPRPKKPEFLTARSPQASFISSRNPSSESIDDNSYAKRGKSQPPPITSSSVGVTSTRHGVNSESNRNSPSSTHYIKTGSVSQLKKNLFEGKSPYSATPSSQTPINAGSEAIPRYPKSRPIQRNANGSVSVSYDKTRLSATPTVGLPTRTFSNPNMNMNNAPPPLRSSQSARYQDANPNNKQNSSLSTMNPFLSPGENSDENIFDDSHSVNDEEYSEADTYSTYNGVQQSSQSPLPPINVANIHNKNMRPSDTASVYSETPSTMTSPAYKASNYPTSPSKEYPIPTDFDIPERYDKYMKTRANIIGEIIETEESFVKDIIILRDIFATPAKERKAFTLADWRLFFPNLDNLIEFSYRFKQDLDYANSSDPAATYIGKAFLDAMPDMETVYIEFCKNNEAALARIGEIVQQESPNAEKDFLIECQKEMQGKTGAWDLSSLIIKPVQRILKFPMFLAQLLKATPPTFDDQRSIWLATERMEIMADRINELKKRKDLVEKYVEKKGPRDIVHGVKKRVLRGAQQVRRGITGTGIPEDEEYMELTKKVDEAAEAVADIKESCGQWISKFKSYVGYIESIGMYYRDCAGINSGKYYTATTRIAGHVQKETVEAMKKQVMTKVDILVDMFEGPRLIIEKCEQKRLDYERVMHMQSKGEELKKHHLTAIEDYEGIRAQLADEIPEFLRLCGHFLGILVSIIAGIQAKAHERIANELAPLGMAAPVFSAPEAVATADLEVDRLTGVFESLVARTSSPPALD